MTKRINTLAIIGVGLIGGSLSLALKKHNSVGRVIGIGRSQANLDEAVRLGVIDTPCRLSGSIMSTTEPGRFGAARIKLVLSLPEADTSCRPSTQKRVVLFGESSMLRNSIGTS